MTDLTLGYLYTSEMTSETSPSLGILSLERGASADAPPLPRPEGALSSPSTYDFPVIIETVAGAWVDNVVRGDPALEGAYVAAAQRLVQRGAVAISSNCGFSVRHQAAVAASVDVPVGMSSLLLLPCLDGLVPRRAKILVMTYDSSHCGKELLGLDDPQDLNRIVIGGVEGGVFWQNEMRRPPPPTDDRDIERDVLARVRSLRAAHPEIGAILLECASFPLTAPALRREERLPVYDITHLCRLMLASVR